MNQLSIKGIFGCSCVQALGIRHLFGGGSSCYFLFLYSTPLSHLLDETPCMSCQSIPITVFSLAVAPATAVQ